MKSLSTLIFITGFLVSYCSGQLMHKQDLKSKHLNGNVRSVKRNAYYAHQGKSGQGEILKDTFGEIIKGEPMTLYGEERYGLNYYDSKGNLTEQYSYLLNGDPDHKSIPKYDDKGNMSEMDDYTPGGNLSNKLVFRYDDKGNMTEMDNDSLDTKRTWTYQYDDRGNMIEINEHYYSGRSGKDYPPVIYRFDEKGFLIEMDSYGDDQRMTSRSVFINDDKGRTTETDDYDPEGVLISKSEYKYDENGNWIERKDTGKGDYSNDDIKYKYKYDNKRNWIRRVTFKNDDPEEIRERVIEYY